MEVRIGSVAAGASVAVATNNSSATAVGGGVVAVAREGETVVVTSQAEQKEVVETEDPRLTSLKEKYDAYEKELDDYIRAGRMDIVQTFLRYVLTLSPSRLGPIALGLGSVSEWSLKPSSEAGAPVMGEFALGHQPPPDTRHE